MCSVLDTASRKSTAMNRQALAPLNGSQSNALTIAACLTEAIAAKHC
ncbi:hypothetical protein EDD27_3564 [Nonomuraea polychroma]|uniref:Uncharacterized protein n=1 Tax=Nonomuraea polychroma TaxID=46176 RepID=A0A438M5L8_9ACTN|nr:hypothetical protein EDD27_3564 [Nonomuraea polychroma]